MSEPDDALLRWAEAVADGEPIDWQEATQSGEAPAPRLERLEILAAIAGACGMPSARPQPSANVLFRWCHLEIRERIGAGAYGEVYRAWDPKLEREVAVKFLRAETLAAAHTLQEGRHLARVRDPGVVMVFGAEEKDGRVGIWMEHVRGETLEDLLQERGPFASHEASLIGIDLCRALAAVHRAGLVHRDVKTRNVVREDSGRIVLMDFGAGVDAKSGNDVHGLAGTPIYLAPEVLEGRAASPQSDLYGLGVLLYRLVTRNYPIAGASLDALRAAHAGGETKLLSAVRPDLPAPFRRVVERALATDPARRFASAEQMEAALDAALDQPRRAARRRAAFVTLSATVFLAALGLTVAAQRTGAPPGPVPDRPPIAVADVVNQVRDPELDALASMLVTSLEQARGLLVLTRSQMTDILAVAGKPTTARIDQTLGIEIGRRASAAAVLIPSVRREDDRYRVILDAVEPRRGKRLFSATAVAQDRDQLAAAIDTLAQRVRAALERGPQASAAVRPLAQIATASLGAYHHYDQAERLIDRLHMPEARAALEQAVAVDSTFGLAHARLAYVCWWLNDQDAERKQLASAFALIDRVPERHRYHLRAQGAMAEREGLEAARAILLEMERFYPQDKEMLYDIGDYSSHLNEFPTAIQYLEKVVAMDPSFARALQHLARVHRDMGRRDSYLAWARRYAAADSVWDTHILLGNALIASGDTAAGIEELARGRELNPEGHASDFGLLIASTRFLQGRSAEGLKELDGLLAATSAPGQRAGFLRERAKGRIHQGAYREALADLEQAAALRRQAGDRVEEAMARMDAALLLMVGRNDPAAAFRQLGTSADLETAITYRQTYFSYWEYWGGLFKLHLLNGDLTAASALARQKFATDKWYGSYVAAYLHAARGECAQAAAAASRVIEWGPASENIPLLYFLARCQLDHGEPDEAVASLLRLQSLYSHLTLGTPYYAKSLLLLGEAYDRKGDPASAARSYSKLLDLWKEGDLDLPHRLAAQRRLEIIGPSQLLSGGTTPR